MKFLKRLFWIMILSAAIGGLLALAMTPKKTAAFRTSEVKRGNIAERVSATGTLSPVEQVDVGTQISGQVKKLYIGVNEEVKKDQLLAEIDPSLLDAQVKQSRAAMETARVNHEQALRDQKRAHMLFDKEYVARVDMERANLAAMQTRNAYDAAKIQLARDEVNLNYTKIRSPIDGIVIAQEITLGQTVAATYQTPNMFKIAGDLTKMKITVNMSESDISKVSAGMPVTFTVDAFPEREFPGVIRIKNVNPTVTVGVVTYTIIVDVKNPEKLLLPGMTAYVTITLHEKKDVLHVPAAALRFTPPAEEVSGLRRLMGAAAPRIPTRQQNNEGGKRTIYLLRDGAPVPVPVNTGAEDDLSVEIISESVHEGDTVITGLSFVGKD